MAMVGQRVKLADATAGFGRLVSLCVLGFLAFVVLLAILDNSGVSSKIIAYALIGAPIAAYAVIGIVTRTSKIDEFYVAGRRVPAIYNGMAAGAGWVPGISFFALTGTLVLLGHDGLAFVLGLSGGFVLIAVLIAPYLRKSGIYTVPEFFAVRFGTLPRQLAVFVLISCSFAYVVAQIYAAGIITARFLDIDMTIAVAAILVAILACSILGGMKSVTWTQVAQYVVLIVAFLVPVIFLSARTYDIPLPQMAYGKALQDIAALEQSMAQKGLASAAALKPHASPFTTYDPLNYFALVLCLMIGTASFPHLLMRFFSTSSVREARSSVGWSLFFVALLCLMAPAYAALSKFEIYSTVIGRPLTDVGPWLFKYGSLGLIKMCGVDAVSLDAVREACARTAGHAGVVRLQDLSISTDAIVLAMPEIAGMPFVIGCLVAAGGLAAALAGASALLLAIANTLSHDIYFKLIDRNATAGRRLIAARLVLLVAAGGAAYLASIRPADILSMVAWAFSLAAAGIFPALVTGIWWKRATTAGAVAGMVLGFGVCVYYLVGTRYFAVPFHEMWGWISAATQGQKETFVNLKQAWQAAPAAGKAAAWTALDSHAQEIAGWWGVRGISAALFGVPVGFIAIWVVSLVTPAPSRETRSLVDAIRRPLGPAILHDKK